MTALRRDLLAGAAALAAGAARAQPPGGRPDILFILADDLGYADLGCYGARGHVTPVLDRLAAEGLRLTHAYASSAVCSATRTALITGRYPQRLPVGLEEPISGTDSPVGLPPGTPTLPSRLRAAGYRTVLVGKWHLGAPPRYGPLRSGYDRFFGFLPGAMDYFRHGAAGGPLDGLFDGETPVQVPGYLTDLFADRAAREIAQAPAGSPLLLSLHFNAPHWPWERPGDAAVASTLKTLRHENGGSLKIYGEMVEAMDAAIARVLAAVQRRGRDTIVVFTSDNGGERFSDMWPFTGQKGELLEGGLRVPAVVRWPSHIRAGSTGDQVIASMDWLPTLLAAAGAPAPPGETDGLDLLPQLTGAASARPRRLFWRFKESEQAAALDGRLKYLRLGGKERLFDVEADPHERADLAGDRPADFARLKSAYAAWDAAMLPYPAASFSERVKGRQADRY